MHSEFLIEYDKWEFFFFFFFSFYFSSIIHTKHIHFKEREEIKRTKSHPIQLPRLNHNNATTNTNTIQQWVAKVEKVCTTRPIPYAFHIS